MAVALDDQFLVNHPVFQDVCAITHQRTGTGPLRAALHVSFLDGIKGEARRQVGKPRQRFIQLNAQGSVIHCGHAQFVRRGLAVDDSLRITNPGQRCKPGEGGRGLRIHQALPAINEILCGDRRTVRPSGVLAQGKGPGAVIITLPACGHPRHQFALFILINKAFEQIADHLNLR